MLSESPTPHASSSLPPRRPPLDYWPGWLVAVSVLVVGFLAYQAAAGFFTLALVMTLGGVSPEALAAPGGIAEVMVGHPKLLLVANGAGQIIGLGLIALVVGWLAARSDWRGWLGLSTRRAEYAGRNLTTDIGWSVLGWVGLIPVVAWVGKLNAFIPLPESIRAVEAAQAELLERVLTAELGLVVPLITVALVPALCEELFFRGAAQRALARSMSGLGAALVIGVAFGFYHLRLSQALPLALLGAYLGYLAWRTQSLWPAVVVHFINNGAAIVGGFLGVTEESDAAVESAQTTLLEGIGFVIGGVILAALVVARLERSAGAKALTSLDADLASPSSPSSSTIPSSSP